MKLVSNQFRRYTLKFIKMNPAIILILYSLFFCYQSATSVGGKILSDRDKEYLVNLARQTLYWYLKDGTIPSVDETILSKSLLQKRDCFVTLDKRGIGLRGCMGIFNSNKPLYQNVIDRAIAAATQDPRFLPVKYEELKDIKLEISVLTEPEELKFNSPEDLIAKLRPMKDGVILETRYGSSTYLPQVWEQLPDKEVFLTELCKKHGAPGDIWRTEYKHIKVFVYEAIVFGEEVYGRRVIGKNGAVVGKGGAVLLGAVAPLREGYIYGGYRVNEGAFLAPGAIVSVDSDIIER